MFFNELNDENLTPIRQGKIYKYYAQGGGLNRQYFSDENAMKIDAIRIKIQDLLVSNKINNAEYFHLLASLLESADKVANTACVYGAFLKNIKQSAQKKLILEPAKFDINGDKHLVYNDDANELIKRISGDILYLDPPYNSRQYGANYHLLNTIAFYDDFIPKGKTGLREYKKSKWCSKNTAYLMLDDLLKSAEFKYIFLSYNNEGIIPFEIIKNIMQKYGHYEIFSTDYKRFKADNKREHKADTTIEYLHFLQKK